MRLRFGMGQRILLIRAEARAKRSNSDQFRPNFRAESPTPARINILWLRTQSNKPSACNMDTLNCLGFSGERPRGRSRADKARINKLERENKGLRTANEILKKASAILPRRSSTARSADDLFHKEHHEARGVEPVCRVLPST